MDGLDGIISPIPKNEKLKEAIFWLVDNVLSTYCSQITSDGKSLEKTLEELKRYEMKIITGDGEYTINLGKYVKEKVLGGILKQADNLGRPYNIMQPRDKNYDFIRFAIYEKSI